MLFRCSEKLRHYISLSPLTFAARIFKKHCKDDCEIGFGTCDCDDLVCLVYL